MGKIAIIGKNKDLLAFNLVGVNNIIILKDNDNLNNIIKKLEEKNFSIIFIEENLIFKIKYKNKMTTTIVGLPDVFNSNQIYNKQNIIHSKIKKIIGENIYTNLKE